MIHPDLAIAKIVEDLDILSAIIGGFLIAGNREQ